MDESSNATTLPHPVIRRLSGIAIVPACPRARSMHILVMDDATTSFLLDHAHE